MAVMSVIPALGRQVREDLYEFKSKSETPSQKKERKGKKDRALVTNAGMFSKADSVSHPTTHLPWVLSCSNSVLQHSLSWWELHQSLGERVRGCEPISSDNATYKVRGLL